jgi:hypothetical protein
MGSSFIEYRGFGFWSFDPFIERLAGEVAAAIENQKEEEEWQADLGAHWKLQASGDFHGWVHLNLDEFLTGEERNKQIRSVVQTVVEQHPTADDPIRETGVFLFGCWTGNLQQTQRVLLITWLAATSQRSDRP